MPPLRTPRSQFAGELPTFPPRPHLYLPNPSPQNHPPANHYTDPGPTHMNPAPGDPAGQRTSPDLTPLLHPDPPHHPPQSNQQNPADPTSNASSTRTRHAPRIPPTPERPPPGPPFKNPDDPHAALTYARYQSSLVGVTLVTKNSDKQKRYYSLACHRGSYTSRTRAGKLVDEAARRRMRDRSRQTECPYRVVVRWSVKGSEWIIREGKARGGRGRKADEEDADESDDGTRHNHPLEISGGASAQADGNTVRTAAAGGISQTPEWRPRTPVGAASTGTPRTTATPATTGSPWAPCAMADIASVDGTGETEVQRRRRLGTEFGEMLGKMMELPLDVQEEMVGFLKPLVGSFCRRVTGGAQGGQDRLGGSAQNGYAGEERGANRGGF